MAVAESESATAEGTYRLSGSSATASATTKNRKLSALSLLTQQNANVRLRCTVCHNGSGLPLCPKMQQTPFQFDILPDVDSAMTHSFLELARIRCRRITCRCEKVRRSEFSSRLLTLSAFKDRAILPEWNFGEAGQKQRGQVLLFRLILSAGRQFRSGTRASGHLTY